MSRIKVLVFINSFRAGGSERQALEVIKRLDRTKFEPFVACFQREGPLLSELPSDIDVIHTFHLRSFFVGPPLSRERNLAGFYDKPAFISFNVLTSTQIFLPYRGVG